MTKLLLIVFVALAIASCDDENNVQPTKEKSYPIVSTYFGYSDLESELDNGNLIGFFELLRIDDKGLQVYGDDEIYSITEIRPSTALSQYAEGTFWDTNLDLVSLGPNIMVNARPLNEYNLGQYDDQGEMEFYSGTQMNKFLIDSNSVFNTVIDSLQFNSFIDIDGITAGDTIDISDGFEFTWTGNPTNLNNRVRVDFQAAYYPLDYQLTDSSYIGLGHLYVENTNSFQIGGLNDSVVHTPWPSPGLNNLVKDMYYHIEVTGYEPHYIPTTTGKDLLVVMVSVSRRTVFVTD